MDVIKVEEVDEVDEAKDDSKGLTFDDTSEFVRAVGNNPVKVKAEPTEVTVAAATAAVPVKQRSPSRDVSMAPGDQALDEIEAGEVTVKEEEDEEDEMAMLDDIEEALKMADSEAKTGTSTIDDGIVGTSSEQTFKSGMGATLNILRQQGVLATPSAEQKDREKTQLQRDLWLAEQRRRVTEREMERLQSRGSHKDQSQREYENRMREQQEARENNESFKNYRPDVNIVYYDEFGRTLTLKEAWKALSHKFHGKGSGKMKTEKRLKKIAEEKKKASMASGDTPLSMMNAFQQRQEKAGQAHFVLSVGNRGSVVITICLTATLMSLYSAVPQSEDFIETQPLSKGKTEKAKKRKEIKNAQDMDTGFITLPATNLSRDDSPGNSNFSSGFVSISGSPAPKAGFSRISSSSVVEASSQGGTPVPSERSKVAFGFGTKRKAADEAQGSPPPKRR